MPNSVSQFPSDNWIPFIVDMCFNFCEENLNNPGGHYLSFRDLLFGTIKKPGKIVKEYHRTASLLKKAIYGDKANQEKIDHHKIAALYIRSILKYKPFSLDIPKESKNTETCLLTEFPNEYFIIDFLEAVFKAANNNINGKLVMSRDYEADFIKLLCQYEKNPSSLDPLSLANTICTIEKLYFKPGRPRAVRK